MFGHADMPCGLKLVVPARHRFTSFCLISVGEEVGNQGDLSRKIKGDTRSSGGGNHWRGIRHAIHGFGTDDGKEGEGDGREGTDLHEIGQSQRWRWRQELFNEVTVTDGAEERTSDHIQPPDERNRQPGYVKGFDRHRNAGQQVGDKEAEEAGAKDAAAGMV